MTAHQPLTPHATAIARAENARHGTCYGYIIIGWSEGEPQHGDTYYASREIAEVDADWLGQHSDKFIYTVERISTAICGLTYHSRIPEMEASAKARKQYDKRRALVSRLVKRGYPYADALVGARNRFPLADDAVRGLIGEMR